MSSPTATVLYTSLLHEKTCCSVSTRFHALHVNKHYFNRHLSHHVEKIHSNVTYSVLHPKSVFPATLHYTRTDGHVPIMGTMAWHAHVAEVMSADTITTIYCNKLGGGGLPP